MIAVAKKQATGRQERYAPFPAAKLPGWATSLAGYAEELRDIAAIAERAGVKEIEIDGGSMFDKHIELLGKAVDRTVAYVRGQARKKGVKI